MLNPITELTANQFLLFYAVLIGATVLLCRWWSRLIDATAAMAVPAVPSEPDPYEIAYLRGGEDEVMKAVIGGLYQRGYLSLDTESEKTFRQPSNHSDVEVLSPLERSVFGWFAEPRTPGEVTRDLRPTVGADCLSFAERFEQERLLTSDEVRDRAQLACIAGTVVIVAIGASRALVGMTRERPIRFLLLMGIVGCLVLWKSCRAPRLSSLGSRYLEELSKSFAWLKGAAGVTAATVQGVRVVPQPAVDRSNFLLLVGVFGLGAAGYGYVEDTIKPKSSASAGGCGGDGCGGCGCGGCD